jgi:DNA-binding NarL/FixJ family response regulator
MKTIKLFLVDDHQLVRDGIKSLLANLPQIKIIGEAENEQQLLDSLSREIPDVILMDISLPGKSGINLSSDILEQHPTIGIIILSMYTNEEFILNALKAGAKGYLPKNTSREELVKAIESVHQGSEFFGETISKTILKSYIRNAKQEQKESSQDILTPRETEILQLVALGYINKEIGDQLDISIRTVETHKNHIMRKLDLKSSVEMAKYAIKNNLISL